MKYRIDYNYMNDIKGFVELTDFAASKIKYFIKHEKNNSKLKLRVYIMGGGCGGFQYGFILDDKIAKDDYVIEKNGVYLVIDPMSLQYLFGGIIDYYEGLEGSKFIITNPNAITTCSCGASFST